MKFCKDCKHALEGGHEYVPYLGGLSRPWRCLNPAIGDPVTGRSITCDLAREGNLLCGRSGRLWEEGDPTPFKPIFVASPPTPEPIRTLGAIKYMEEPEVTYSLWRRLLNFLSP